MLIRPLQHSDREELVRMRQLLWPSSREDEVDDSLSLPISDGIIVVAERPQAGLGGFAEIGLRRFAEGCDGSPVAYLEGIWTDRDARRSGLASALVRRGEAWAISRGLSEFASDCDAENSESEAFHRAAGFEIVHRSLCFRRRLTPEST